MMAGHPSAPLLQALVGDEEVATFFSDDAELAALLRFESALAAAEANAGLLPNEAAEAIDKACLNFKPDWPALAGGIARDGVVVPALVKQLRQRVGDPHAQFVHWGATSQDAIDSALVLRLKDILAVFLQRLESVLLTLEELKKRDGALPLMAHTRMQQALPFTAADKLETWIAPLRRHRERLLTIAPHVLAIQLGGPVGTRAELGQTADLVAQDLARLLGLSAAPSWHSQRDRIAEFGSFLSLLSGTLGKIGQDIALMAQNEVAAISLPAGGGSSAMAHKSNPVGAEIVVALARFNAGLVGILHQAQVHENERSGAAWTLEWMVLPQMAIATAAGLQKTLALVGEMRFVVSR